MISIVLDANVVKFAVEANSSANSYGLAPANILTDFIDSDNKRIVVDLDTTEESETGSKILDEYISNLENSSSKGLTPVLKRIIQHDLDSRSENKLISWEVPINESKVDYFRRNGFHKSDLIFLRVGSKSTERLIVSCDGNSLIDEEFSEEAEEEFDLRIVDPSEFPDDI